MKEAVIFDMDGTLFETEHVCLLAFHKTFDYLNEEGYFTGERPSDDLLLNQLGKTVEDFWVDLLPGKSVDLFYHADEVMFRFEKELIQEGKGRLYPYVKEVLTKLHKHGASLFVASNGREDYIQAIVDYFKLNEVFVDLYSAGRFKTKSKNDLVCLLKETYNLQTAYMVGDRHSDVEAGKVNGFKVIGCNYGFADPKELEGADYIIRSFDEIIDIVNDYT